MGLCCSSRTDLAGKDKNAAAGKGKKTAGGKASVETKGGKAVKFNPMDAVRNTITKVCKDSKLFLLTLT